MIMPGQTSDEGSGQTATSSKALATLDSLCDMLTKERPLGLLLLASLVVACIFCLSLFDIHFLLGTSAFWKNPRGIIGNSWGDISTALSGYLYFQRDSWQLPLFHVGKLGGPAGTNIIFTDSIPLVALAGRLAFRLTGMPVNLYGLWTAFCFVASAMTMTALVAALGQRNIAAAAMATISGLCMPALLARWGHMSLMAQFEVPLALIFYLRNRCRQNSRQFFIQATGLLSLTLWTHTYLFVMDSAIVLATIAHAVSRQRIGTLSAIRLLTGLTLTIGILIALSGHLQSAGELAAHGFGAYSLNLLSPFVPQRSGVFSALRNVTADATGGQYEGFAYLGTGVLMLLLMTLPWQWRKFPERMRHNAWMSALLICFTMFALSNIVYLGGLRLVEVPLPQSILEAAGIFRSSGRFFWPVMYCMAALAIVAPIEFYGRYGVLLLCLAVPLQWIDSTPLRQAVWASSRAPERPHIDLAAWETAIRRHDSVWVLPQYACLERSIGWNAELAVQLQLLAALANRPINSVYSARPHADCAAERRLNVLAPGHTQVLSVILDEFAETQRAAELAANSKCHTGGGITVCSDNSEAVESLNTLARTDSR